MPGFEECKRAISQSNWRLYVVSIGLTMVLAPQYNLMSLQTSIGVKNATGSTSVVLFSTLSVVSLLVYIPLIARFGRKKCLVVGEIPAVLYTMSYFFPKPWIITTAGVLVGFSESIMTPASAVVITSLAHPSDETYNPDRNTFNVGVLLTIRGLGQALASIIPNAILVDSGKQPLNVSASTAYDVSRCGANDCPKEYAFSQHSKIFGNLIPTQDSLRIYLCVMSVTQLFGIIIHCLAVPAENNEGSEERQSLLPQVERSAVQEFKQAILRLLDHFRSKFRWLTISVHVMYGLNTGFIWSEISRAYVSCPFGVENLGSFFFLLYLASFLGNATCTKFCSGIQMPVIYVSNVVITTSAYCLALFWAPSETSLYVPYLLVLLMGLTHFIVRYTSFVISSNYFDDMDSAYLIQTGVAALGNATVFMLANVMCVYIKLYIIMSFSLFSTALVFVAHFCYRPSE